MAPLDIIAPRVGISNTVGERRTSSHHFQFDWNLCHLSDTTAQTKRSTPSAGIPHCGTAIVRDAAQVGKVWQKSLPTF